MKKIRDILLVLRSDSYFIITERGAASKLQNTREELEYLQDQVIKFDEWLEDHINELILEERI